MQLLVFQLQPVELSLQVKVELEEEQEEATPNLESGHPAVAPEELQAPAPVPTSAAMSDSCTKFILCYPGTVQCLY